MRISAGVPTWLTAAALTVGCGAGGSHAPAPAAGDVALDVAPVHPAATGRRDAPAASVWREVTLPEGTSLSVALDTAVGSDTSALEDPVRAHVTRPVVVDGLTVVPEGSTVGGVVTAAARAGRVQGTSRLAMRFDSLEPTGAGRRYEIATSTVARRGATQKKKDALQIAGPAAGGAIVGGLVGGKKGAVIGGAAGGGAGTAVVLTQRGKDVRLGRGAAITLRLTEPVTIRVKS